MRGPHLPEENPILPIEDSAETPSVPVPPATKTASAKKSPGKASDSSARWDEKSIRSLGLAEVKNRLNQLSTWPPGPNADRVERWLVKRWASLEPREACQYAYAAVLQGAETSLLEESIKVWAEISPAMASNWASSLGSPSLRDLAVRVAFQVWAGKDATAAAQAQTTVKDAWVRGTVAQQKATGMFAQITSAQGGRLVAAASPSRSSSDSRCSIWIRFGRPVIWSK